MSKLVTGSHVGVLEGDADNIVELILDSYTKITSSVQVKVCIMTYSCQINFFQRTFNLDDHLFAIIIYVFCYALQAENVPSNVRVNLKSSCANVEQVSNAIIRRVCHIIYKYIH